MGTTHDNTNELPTSSTLTFTNKVAYGAKCTIIAKCAQTGSSGAVDDLRIQKSFDGGTTWSTFGSLATSINSGSRNTSTTAAHNHSYNYGWAGNVVLTEDDTLNVATTGSYAFSVKFRITADSGGDDFTSFRWTAIILNMP